MPSRLSTVYILRAFRSRPGFEEGTYLVQALARDRLGKLSSRPAGFSGAGQRRLDYLAGVERHARQAALGAVQLQLAVAAGRNARSVGWAFCLGHDLP